MRPGSALAALHASRAASRGTPKADEVSGESYKQRSADFFSSGKYSDVTITCGSRRWKVHKLQLSQHSPVFEAMLQGQFKEGQPSASVNLPEDDEKVVNEMLRYMYHYDYYPSAELSNLILHMEVARIADKYQMRDLQEAARNRFSINMDGFFGYSKFAEAVQEAFSNDGYEYFRKTLVQATVVKIRRMRQRPDEHKELWEAVETVPSFAAEVLRAPLLIPEEIAKVPPSGVRGVGTGFNQTLAEMDDAFTVAPRHSTRIRPGTSTSGFTTN